MVRDLLLPRMVEIERKVKASVLKGTDLMSAVLNYLSRVRENEYILLGTKQLAKCPNSSYFLGGSLPTYAL